MYSHSHCTVPPVMQSRDRPLNPCDRAVKVANWSHCSVQFGDQHLVMLGWLNSVLPSEYRMHNEHTSSSQHTGEWALARAVSVTVRGELCANRMSIIVPLSALCVTQATIMCAKISFANIVAQRMQRPRIIGQLWNQLFSNKDVSRALSSVRCLCKRFV